MNGNINFATSLSTTVASTVTLVATGSLNISSPNMNFIPYTNGLVFFADVTTSNTGLQISGSNGTWNGIAYAPHSNHRYSGSSNVSGNGSLVGYTISMTGSSRITYRQGAQPWS